MHFSGFSACCWLSLHAFATRHHLGRFRFCLLCWSCVSECAFAGTRWWDCDCDRGIDELPDVTFEFANATKPVMLTPGQYAHAQPAHTCLGYIQHTQTCCNHASHVGSQVHGQVREGSLFARVFQRAGELAPLLHPHARPHAGLKPGLMRFHVTPMQSMETWLLGDRFLVNRYVVYDYDNCE